MKRLWLFILVAFMFCVGFNTPVYAETPGLEVPGIESVDSAAIDVTSESTRHSDSPIRDSIYFAVYRPSGGHLDTLRCCGSYPIFYSTSTTKSETQTTFMTTFMRPGTTNYIL